MQREFEIFTKPSAEPVAVKRGFSWPGFFFLWIWAFSRRLWVEGIVIALIYGTNIYLKLTALAAHTTYCVLFLIGLKIFIGIRGNYWRSRKLEQDGYGFEALVSARSGGSALAIFKLGGKSKPAATLFSNPFFSSPRWCQKVLAVVWLTWKAALRFKLFLVIAALLVLAVVGLPLVIRDDGSAQGFTQIILTYTLSAITALLGLSTLWLSCGTLARDIEECQMQVLVTKPIARWQIWLGKWLGIVSLNAALLAISGASVFGLLQYRASQLPPEVQETLRTQILVARGSAKEPNNPAEIEQQTRQVLQDRLKDRPVDQADLPELLKQIQAQVLAGRQIVPPSYQRIWKIDLGFAKNSLRGKPLQLRVKFNSANQNPGGTFTALWQIGDPPKTQAARLEPMSLAPDTFHEFEIPADMFDDNGVLTVTFVNPNTTALLFPLDEGLEVLYPESSFALNFARGLGVIFCWMALMAALGLAAASLLSFPVAAFFALAMLLLVFSSGTLADSVDSGTVAGGNEETGQMGHSIADVVLIPAFKGVLAVVNLAKNFSPIDALSTGRSITWSQLGQAFAQIVLLLGGIFAVAGITFFNRRELATAQGTQ